MRVVITHSAARDLVAMRQWLTQPGAGRVAETKLDQIRRAIRSLRSDFARWPLHDVHGAHEFSVAGYRVIYSVETDRPGLPDEVVVLRVFGPGQDRSRR